MPAHSIRVPAVRALTIEERALLGWLIDHGTGDAVHMRTQLQQASVVATCACGCASIDVAVDGVEEAREEPMQVVADFAWKTKTGHLCGAYLFTRRDRLAGLDLWSIDGAVTPAELPAVEELFSYANIERG